MHFFLMTITMAFFFVSHSIYKNLREPYIKNFYINIIVYIALLVLGQSFWLLFNEKLNKFIEYPLYIVVFVFSFMFFYYLIIDWVRFFYLKNNIQILDSRVLILAILLGIYGFFNRYNVKITNYKIKTDKDIKLKIAFVSDIHIGDSGINSIIMDKVINKVNSENVDLVILGGDIVEKNYRAFTETGLNQHFKKLKSTYGVFAVLGNHEYYGGTPYKITETLEKNGNMKVLNDELIEFEDFILIGREDPTKVIFGEKRKDLEKILKINSNKFKIVADHNPINFKDSVKNNIDLQLSGHTHNGQFFPFNLIVKFFYKKSYGLLKENGSKLITSSGLSTWRIPIKLGSKPEIVIVEIN